MRRPSVPSMVQIAVGAAITPFREPLAPSLVVAGAAEVIVVLPSAQPLTLRTRASRWLSRGCHVSASSALAPSRRQHIGEPHACDGAKRCEPDHTRAAVVIP